MLGKDPNFESIGIAFMFIKKFLPYNVA